MARVRAKGRGSPEAVEKRRSARALNTLFAQGGSSVTLDGRTEKRRQRLIKELREGRRGKPLKPIDVLTHACELFELGETLATLRKHGVKPIASPDTEEMYEAARRVQIAYSMPVEVFKLIGLELEAASESGTSSRARRKRG